MEEVFAVKVQIRSKERLETLAASFWRNYSKEIKKYRNLDKTLLKAFLPVAGGINFPVNFH